MVRKTACFAGTRLAALQAVERQLDVESILTVNESRVHRYCLANDIDVNCIQPGSRPAAYSFLERQTTDFVLSAGFPFILPLEVLDSGPVYINSHPALLPVYKGYHAIRDAFAANEEYMGVTVHYMIPEVDAGEPLVQERARVRGLSLDQVFELLFAEVEPRAITRAITKLLSADE